MRQARRVLRFRRERSANCRAWRRVHCRASLMPDITAALEQGHLPGLFAADLIDGLVDQLDDVKLIEGHLGPGKVRCNAGSEAGGHVDADVAYVFSATAMCLQVFAEGIDNLGLAALAGEQQAPLFQIVKQADIAMPAPCCRFVQTDGLHLPKILLGTRGLHVAIEDAPDAHGTDLEQLRHFAHCHRFAQGDHQRFHELTEAAARTCPGRFHLGGLTAGLAADPGNPGVDIGLIPLVSQHSPAAST